MTATLMLANAPAVHAATPPDACFNFNAGTGTIDDYYDNESNNGANPACTRDVDIPATIGGVAVTSIGDGSFSGKSLTSVTIPSSVFIIGNNAFNGNQLTTVTVPNSVTTINSRGFENNLLTSVTLGSSVDIIEDNAFETNQLTTVTIPNSVTAIGSYAFKDNQLTNLTLGSSVVTIGNSAFEGNQLISLVIPNSVTAIGGSAFLYNHLTSLTLGNSVTTIGSYAFNSNQLTNVTIPNSVTTINQGAFIGNSSMSYEALTVLIYSGDPVQAQQGLDAIRLVHLFTEDPSNPNGLQDNVMTEADIGFDINGDGELTAVVGGHLINPAAETVQDPATVPPVGSNSNGSGVLASSGQQPTFAILMGLVIAGLSGLALRSRQFRFKA